MKQQKIVIRIMMEVMGSPKEHVENTLKQLTEKLKQASFAKILNEKTVPAELQENKFWSAFSEVELEVNSLQDLTIICYDFTPSTLEILEPAGMDIDTNDITEFLNDQLARLHQISAIIKNREAERIMMVNKLNEFAKLLKENNIEYEPELSKVQKK